MRGKWGAVGLVLGLVALIGLGFQAASSESDVTVTRLELFFIATTVVSLFFNIVQYRDSRRFNRPIFNSLLALFNDIKQKVTSVLVVQQSLYVSRSEHEHLDTLKQEYALFSQHVLGYLQGFQESVVGALQSLNPSDPTGERAFSASEYGLTDQEKELRKLNLDRVRRQLEQTEGSPANGQGVNAEESEQAASS